MKKTEQILMFCTCLLMLLAAAIGRSSKAFGYDVSNIGTQKAEVGSIPTKRMLADGTMVVNTTELDKECTGYGGKVPLEIKIKDGRITDIVAMENSESPDFFERASTLFGKWKGKTIEDAGKMKVDGITGATHSSKI